MVAAVVFSSLVVSDSAFAQGPPVRITLDQAIQMALRHNHTLQAARTTIQQNQAAEITANLRPNPTFFTDWEYLPVFSHPQGESVADYLQASTEGDMGLSYLIERGNKRARRLEAARDATAVTRAQVADNERGTAFQVGALFVNAQLARVDPRTRADGSEELSGNGRHQRSSIQRWRHERERLPENQAPVAAV